MFHEFDIQQDNIERLITFMQKDLEAYKASGNAKELFVKKQKRTIDTILNYFTSTTNLFTQFTDAIERTHELKAQARRLELENRRIKENYQKLTMYAKAHGIDVDLVEGFVHIKDFYY